MNEKKIKNGKIRKYISKFISLNKIKLQRGYGYISTFGIPFLVARELGEIFPRLNWVILFIVAICGVWIIGHIDYKKLWKNELEYSFKNNPEWIKMMKERGESK